MKEMTLPSRHRIRNSSPGGLRPSMLPLYHRGSPQYQIFTSERGRNILFLWNCRPDCGSNPWSQTFQGSISVSVKSHLVNVLIFFLDLRDTWWIETARWAIITFQLIKLSIVFHKEKCGRAYISRQIKLYFFIIAFWKFVYIIWYHSTNK